MLFLQPAADGSANDAPVGVPVGYAAGLSLERALLAADGEARLAEVAYALNADQNLANWALSRAETRMRRSVNHVDEAATLLAGNLVAELGTALRGDGVDSSPTTVESRLLALVKKLADYERQLANFEQRVEREKLDAMKELAYGASHEINNPLANIAARAQTLLEDEEDPQRRQKLVAIHRQAMRAHEMISDLMLFARPPKLDREVLGVKEFIQKVAGGLVPLAQERGVQLDFDENAASARVSADETQMGVALHALIKNAIEAVDEGGRVSIAVRQIKVANEPWIEIVVSDDGPGISAEVRRHIFDPFFSGREAGRGLGFGLSKCWRIVTDHGGQVVVHSPAAGGAEISILLPAAESAAIDSAQSR